jgi:hypothetical protein
MDSDSFDRPIDPLISDTATTAWSTASFVWNSASFLWNSASLLWNAASFLWNRRAFTGSDATEMETDLRTYGRPASPTHHPLV